jgi:rhamnulokinase
MVKYSFLAFDLGAESGRAILGILENDVLRLQEVYRFSNGCVDIRGRFYWNAFSLFGELKKALVICGQNYTKQVESLAIDTWGVDFGLLGTGGNLLSMPRSYRDPHTTGMVSDFSKNIMPLNKLYEQSGIQTMQINTLFQLYALKKTGSPILATSSDLLFIPDLLNYFFTGEMKTEYSIASTSQLLNPYTKEWNKPLFDAIGIPLEIMQKLVFPGEITGIADKFICEQSGLKQLPVISVASHDTASAIAAIPSTDRNWAYLSSGTWSLMGLELDHPLINESTAAQNFTNEGGVDGTYHFLKNMCGLWLLQQCKKVWDRDFEYTYDQLVQLAAEAEPFKVLIDIDAPEFLNPTDMPGAIKEYCKKTGQEPPKYHSCFVRCILDSLAMKYRMVMTQLKEHSQNPISKLYIIGGGAKNKLLCQLTANALNMQVITGPAEATAVGNILMQAKAMGHFSSLAKVREVVRNSFESEVFIPEDIDTWETQEKIMTKLIEKYTNQQQQSLTCKQTV